jgi:hypothetical protein
MPHCSPEAELQWVVLTGPLYMLCARFIIRSLRLDWVITNLGFGSLGGFLSGGTHALSLTGTKRSWYVYPQSIEPKPPLLNRPGCSLNRGSTDPANLTHHLTFTPHKFHSKIRGEGSTLSAPEGKGWMPLGCPLLIQGSFPEAWRV